jgi:ankyrin repeat protein
VESPDPTELFAAIEASDTERVRQLVAASPEVAGGVNAEGVSAILFAHYRSQIETVGILRTAWPELRFFDAAALGDVDRLDNLLAADANLAQAFAADGFTGLQLAAFLGQLRAVELLLAKGAAVNAKARNAQDVAALHAGAAGRDLEVCRLLLDAGADVNSRQQAGWTALHSAAMQGNSELVALLLEAGADRTLADDAGQAPAATAVAAGHPELAEMLQPRA